MAGHDGGTFVMIGRPEILAVRSIESRDTRQNGGDGSAAPIDDDVRRSALEAIGRVTCGVVHDFNNLLCIIKGSVELLQSHDLSDESRQLLVDVSRAVDRGAELTDELLAFVRRPNPRSSDVDIASALSSIERLLARIAGPKVRLTIAHGPPHTLVSMHQSNLERVLFNVVANARDAMPAGGELTIATSRSDVLPPSPRAVPAPGQSSVNAGGYVLITVRDNGRGMDPRTTARAFEPFFTTKHKDQGTGVGLSTARSIVEQSNGHMWIESAIGVGTTVSVLVPITRTPETRRRSHSTRLGRR
jgi:two-component system cell cycle sensor histidine kinase/response regulator CckA